MAMVIRVRFKRAAKLYDFDPNGLDLHNGMSVVTETARGVELGECMSGIMDIPDERLVLPLKPIIRIATEEDLEIQRRNEQAEKEAFDIALDRIAEHKLEMKLVDVEYAFDHSKIIFYFTANGRVDFRMLVKSLASIFKTRIELRQIGVRDEAKMLGGLGMCGRPFCCSQFLTDFQPVSTKMAKTQSLSLNPTKISGVCGRLMCCLRYEEEAYESLVKAVPKNGAFVETPAGFGTVTQVNLLRGNVKVKLDGEGEAVIKSYSGDEIAVVPGGRPKNGEAPVHVLKPRPAAEHETGGDEEPDLPTISETAPAAEPAEQQPRSASVRRKSHRGGRRSGGSGEKPDAARREPKPEAKRDGRQGEKPRRQQQSKPRPQQPEQQPKAETQSDHPKRSPRRRRSSRGGKPRENGAQQSE